MIDPGMRDDGPDLTERLLRQFAGLWLVFIGGFSLLLILGRDRPILGAVLGLLAVIPALSGLVRPASVEPLFRLAMAVAMPIGWVVSHVLMAAIFYLVITPVGLFFRIIGRDAMARRAPTLPSQWVPRESSADPRRYWHQS